MLVRGVILKDRGEGCSGLGEFFLRFIDRGSELPGHLDVDVLMVWIFCQCIFEHFLRLGVGRGDLRRDGMLFDFGVFFGLLFTNLCHQRERTGAHPNEQVPARLTGRDVGEGLEGLVVLPGLVLHAGELEPIVNARRLGGCDLLHLSDSVLRLFEIPQELGKIAAGRA